MDSAHDRKQTAAEPSTEREFMVAVYPAAIVFGIPELVEHIASFLSPNEVACALRLTCKTTAVALRGPKHTTVQLSKPAPHSAFAYRWGRPGAMRGLPLSQRQTLLHLVARSGDLNNLKLALSCCGLQPNESFAKAAASAGQLEACKMLQRQGCPIGNSVAVAAAGSGSRELCDWVMGTKGPYYRSTSDHRTLVFDMAAAAARNGHVRLMEWLLPRASVSAPPHRHYDSPRTALLAALAHGVDLVTLQRYHRAWVAEPLTYPNLEGDPLFDDMPALVDDLDEEIVIAAAGSPTPDWAAKVAWLQEIGYHAPPRACELAASRPDACERLLWLLAGGRSFRLVSWFALEAAAAAGNVVAVRQLLCEHNAGVAGLVVQRIAAEGRLEALRLLYEHGARFDAPLALEAAARGGHLPLVKWLMELIGEGAAGPSVASLMTATAAAAVAGDAAKPEAAAEPAVAVVDARGEAGPWSLSSEPWVFSAAASSGNRELMELLLARGCRWSDVAFCAAAGTGSVEQLEWMAASGCPMGIKGEAYQRASMNGNLAALECLRRLGCPEPPPPPRRRSAASSAAAGAGGAGRCLRLSLPLSLLRRW